MAKLTKKQLIANGKKITNKAKQIRKANKNKKWTTCMKEAGKSLKGKL
jgi:hypothetical protein